MANDSEDSVDQMSLAVEGVGRPNLVPWRRRRQGAHRGVAGGSAEADGGATTGQQTSLHGLHLTEDELQNLHSREN
jgi:hypothetical protein